MMAKKKSKVSKVSSFTFDTFREELAMLEHEQWCAWAYGLLQEESRITKKRRERWEKLLGTNWEDLPAKVKKVDYEFADKVIAMFAMNALDNILIIGEYILETVYPEDVFFGSSDDPGVQYIDAMRQALRRIKEIRGES